MKTVLAVAMILSSFTTFAAEQKVLEVSRDKVQGMRLSTRFEVNIAENIIGVSLTGAKTVGGPRNHHTVHKTFEAVVPELSLAGDDLLLNNAINCGTMGKTRVFKIPVLKLSGACELSIRKSKEKVEVFLVTE